MTSPAVLDHDQLATTTCYLYGIALAAEAPLFPSAAGVLTSPVQCLVENGLAAFLSDLRADQVAEVRAKLAADDPHRTVEMIGPLLEAHDRVVGEIFSETTVLPLRFGTLLPSRAAVATVLTVRHGAVADAIRHLEGKDEWELLVTGFPAAAASETKSDAAATVPRGRAYLEQKRQELERREVARTARMQIATLVHDHARANAAAATVRDATSSASLPPGRELILQATYLVARESREPFARGINIVLDRLDEFDVRGQLTGPWPPYSFVSLRLGEDG